MMKKLFVLLFVAIAQGVQADTPLPPPSVQKTWAVNRQYFVVTNPFSKRTQIFDARNPKRPKKMWMRSGYFRRLDLSNDGKCLVAGDDQLGLLWPDHAANHALVRFYTSKGLIGKVTVTQLFPDRSKLQRTVSHYAWGSNLGFDKQGRYVVETVDGRIFSYSAATAKLLHTTLRRPNRSYEL